jgi:hypothetical protein
MRLGQTDASPDLQEHSSAPPHADPSQLVLYPDSTARGSRHAMLYA